jgi:phthiodiolone/phenolphthiodiolone dimycocerosates ketoreductase
MMSSADIPSLEISAAAPARPPIAGIRAGIARRAAQGFDAVWWADHLLHWFPTSIWTKDLVPQAEQQPSPHVWMDPFAVIAGTADAAPTMRLGVGVTDTVRRHPAALAQTALTLDHITEGRFILGVGTGESLNLTPLGMENHHPVGRLEEALTVLRMLFATSDEIDFSGRHLTLRAVAVGLRPFGATPPPIWVAAHGPRGLEMTGRLGDGWLPLCPDPATYADMWAQVQASRQAAGRDADAITPGCYVRVVIAEDDEHARRLATRSLLLRFIALTGSSEAFHRHGVEHPLGAGVMGLTQFVPSGLTRAHAQELAEKVPDGVILDTVIAGSPQSVASQLAKIVRAGARHLQIVNMTPLADPTLASSSEEHLGAAIAELRSVIAT